MSCQEAERVMPDGTLIDQSRIPPPRSALYVPGSNARALQKAPTLGADALIIDLEDSVAPEAKAEARQATRAFLEGSHPPAASDQSAPAHLRTVRINALDTDQWQADLEMILPGHPDAVVVPKVDRVEELSVLTTPLKRLDPQEKITLWAMIESPLAVLNAFAIAGHGRVSALMMGTSDLSRELRPLNAMLRRRGGLLRRRVRGGGPGRRRDVDRRGVCRSQR